jgi:uncharacterized protein YbjT (DUF2867 family)
MSGMALVTGATGFIGGRLTARLGGAGQDVRCLVRDRRGAAAEQLTRDGFDLHEGDVTRPQTLSGAGPGVDGQADPDRRSGRTELRRDAGSDGRGH